MIKPHNLQGVYVEPGKRKKFFTRNLVPGTKVYGEDAIVQDGVEYRSWDIKKSKLGAALAKGISQLGIKPGNKVLYLGCASGTTPSHVSDLVGDNGYVFALDFAPRVVREIVFVCESRPNMCPILADAFHPESYYHQVLSVDAIFQDIAQRNQAEIFLKNCNTFLKKGGFAILSLKAKSIDQKRPIKAIFADIRAKLEKELIVVDYKTLDPFEMDHCIFVCKKK